MAPVYWDYFNDFAKEEVLEFYTALAEVTDFWDFSMSSVSYEMRYFYDATHFRNPCWRHGSGTYGGTMTAFMCRRISVSW